MADYLPSDEILMRYIDNEMSETEKEDFEKNLTSDPALRQQLERLLMAKDAVRYYGLAQSVEAVRNEWEGRVASGAPGAKIIPIKTYVRYIFAAACLIILIIGITTVYRYFSVSTDRIYQQTYIAYTPGTPRSEAGSSRPIEEAYRQKKFTEVIRLSEGAPLNARERLLLGLSYLETGNPAAAIKEFGTIRSGADPTYIQDAEFYQALAFVKNKEAAKSLPLFEKIFRDKNHLYHQRVTEETISDVKKVM
jgi:hypothetical protein